MVLKVRSKSELLKDVTLGSSGHRFIMSPQLARYEVNFSFWLMKSFFNSSSLTNDIDVPAMGVGAFLYSAAKISPVILCSFLHEARLAAIKIMSKKRVFFM